MSNNFTSGMAGPAAVATLNLLWDRVTEQIVGNSTTSLALGTGAKTLTIEASKQFALGQTARITYNSDINKWMQGTVSAYNASTGELSVVVDAVGGSGTYAAWTVALAATSQVPQVGIFATEALGRAAVTDGSTFRVQGSGDTAAYEYQRINSGASTLLATYAAQPAVARLKAVAAGKNIFDAAAPVLDDFFFFYDLIANAGSICSGLVPVLPGKAMYISRPSLAYANAGIGFYDADQAYLGWTSAYIKTGTFTTPANCAYVQFSLSFAGEPYDDVQLEYGTAGTSFAPYQQAAAEIYDELANGYRLKKINPGVNLFDVESLVSDFALSDTGVAQARSGGKMFTPIPVTAGQTYTLSGKAGAGYQSRDTVGFFSYSGASPVVMADFVAGATLISYTIMAAGMVTVPAGATHIAINADFYYGTPVATIKETYADFMLQAGSMATADPTFQKPSKSAHQRPVALLSDLINYKNYNNNFGLDILSRIEDEDFYIFNEYRSPTSRTYYDFLKPVANAILASKGITNKVGFADATEGFISVGDGSLYRRVGIRIPLSVPIKRFANYDNYDTLGCTFFVEANPSNEMAFFTSLAPSLDQDIITGEAYAPAAAMNYADTLYAPSSDTSMTIGKLYYLGSKTVKKLAANLYEVSFINQLYGSGATQTAYITSVNFLVGLASVSDPSMFYVAGIHVYKKEADEFAMPRASYASPYPKLLMPLRTDIIKVSKKSDAMVADQRELLSGGWYGKKIVWLGTSVPNEPPFGEGGTDKYPNMVAAMTGARVNVRAYGGSYVTWDPANTVYGLAGSAADFTAASKAQTSSEVAWDTALTDMWDSEIFIFDHLHNDAGALATLAAGNGGVLPAITSGNEYDRTWAVGALNYIIREIYRRNPRARIGIINDYRAEFYWNKTANQMVADYWGLPIMNPRMAARNTDIVLAADITYTKYDGTTATLTSGSTINPLKFITKAAPDEPTPSGSDTIHLGRYGRILFAKQVVRWMRNELTPEAVNADYQ